MFVQDELAASYPPLFETWLLPESFQFPSPTFSMPSSDLESVGPLSPIPEPLDVANELEEPVLVDVPQDVPFVAHEAGRVFYFPNDVWTAMQDGFPMSDTHKCS